MATRRPLSVGDYVLATKYHDGYPGDLFCVGFVYGFTGHDEPRVLVQDSNGTPLSANGFRRARRISAARGKWMLDRWHVINESSRNSVWWWARQPMGGDNGAT